MPFTSQVIETNGWKRNTFCVQALGSRRICALVHTIIWKCFSKNCSSHVHHRTHCHTSYHSHSVVKKRLKSHSRLDCKWCFKTFLALKQFGRESKTQRIISKKPQIGAGSSWTHVPIFLFLFAFYRVSLSLRVCPRLVCSLLDIYSREIKIAWSIHIHFNLSLCLHWSNLKAKQHSRLSSWFEQERCRRAKRRQQKMEVCIKCDHKFYLLLFLNK